MYRFGGNPFPLQSRPIVSQIQETYLDGCGSAFDREGDALQVESATMARGLASVWCKVEQAKGAFLPSSTVALPSWEKVFGLNGVGLSEGQRRINLELAWLKIGLPAKLSVLLDRMNEIFGASLFAGYRTTTPSDAASDGTASIPGGGGALLGVSYPDDDWRSAAASICIELNNLTSSDAHYASNLRTMIDTAYAFLDSILPAWVQVEFIMGDHIVGSYPSLDFGELA